MVAAVFLSSGSILPIYFIAGMDRARQAAELEYGSRGAGILASVRRSPTRTARDIRLRLKDIDRRLADIESYVTTENRSLAREIEQLR